MPSVAVVYEGVIVEVDAEQIQFLRRTLHERQDKFGRGGHAANAMDHGIPDGTVHLEHADVLAIVEAVEQLRSGERRLVDDLVRLSRILLAEQDRQLSGERGADSEHQ